MAHPESADSAPMKVYYTKRDLDNVRVTGSPSPTLVKVGRMQSPILGLKDHSARHFKERPKTVPPSLGREKAEQARTRPKSAFPTNKLDPDNCDRLQDILHEPTRKHTLTPHLAPRRRTTCHMWQKQLDASPVPVVVTPGYILAKSKDKTQVFIKTDELSVQDPEVISARKEDPERDFLIEQLSQQIDDLKLYLEEERQNHLDTRQQLTQQLKDRTEEMNTMHKHRVLILRKEFQEKASQAQKAADQILEEAVRKRDEHLAKVEGEMEYLQGAFESYKTQLHLETAEKWDVKVKELQEKFTKEKSQSMQEREKDIKAELVKEKLNMETRFKEERAGIYRNHKSEVDKIIRRFANQAAQQEELKRLKDEAVIKQSEMDSITENYNKIYAQAQDLHKELEETKRKLMKFEVKFNDLVSEAKDEADAKVDKLKKQNTEIRQMYIKKCGELFDQRSIAEESDRSRIQKAKTAMEKNVQPGDS